MPVVLQIAEASARARVCAQELPARERLGDLAEGSRVPRFGRRGVSARSGLLVRCGRAAHPASAIFGRPKRERARSGMDRARVGLRAGFAKTKPCRFLDVA